MFVWHHTISLVDILRIERQTSLHLEWRITMLHFYHGPTYTPFKLPIIQRTCFGLDNWSYASLAKVHEKRIAYLNDPPNGLLPEESTKCTVSEWFCFAHSSNSFHLVSGLHPFPAKSYSFYLGGGAEKLIFSMYQIQMYNFPPFHYCICRGNHKQFADNQTWKLCCRVARSIPFSWKFKSDF